MQHHNLTYFVLYYTRTRALFFSSNSIQIEFNKKTNPTTSGSAVFDVEDPKLWVSNVAQCTLDKSSCSSFNGGDNIYPAASSGSQSKTWTNVVGPVNKIPNMNNFENSLMRFKVSDKNWVSSTSGSKDVGYVYFSFSTVGSATLHSGTYFSNIRESNSFSASLITTNFGTCQDLNCVKNSNCYMSLGGTGVANYDAYFLITTHPANPGNLGGAVNCGRGEDDRPTVGAINFAFDPIKAYSDSDVNKQAIKALAIHEMMHALGFSTESFPLFIDRSTGARWNTDIPMVRPTFKCSQNGDIQNIPAASWIKSKFGDLIQPTFASYRATNVVSYDFVERGVGATCPLKNSPGSVGIYGECIQKIITPAVKREARNYFGCADLEGMELENHGNSGYNGDNCKMRESHFEARLIADELMISTAVSFTQRISPMTLAVFEDSGWYQVDYSQAGLVNDAPFVNIDTTKPGYLPFVEGIDSGFKKGCGYARDHKCIDSNQQPTDERWCTDVPKRQSDGSDVWSTLKLADRDITIQQGPGWECHPNRMGYGMCTLTDISTNKGQTKYYDWFLGTKQGMIPFPDFCPWFSNGKFSSSSSSSFSFFFLLFVVVVALMN